MKKLFCGALLLGVVSTRSLWAITYQDTDLLLVFRQNGQPDVLFNVGSVSNYQGLASGTTVPVTNWSLNLVKANNNNTLAGVQFILMAATPTTPPLGSSANKLWLTDAVTNDAPAAVGPGEASAGRLNVHQIGLNAATYAPGNTTNTWVVSSGASYSYTQVLSPQGNSGLIPSFGGTMPFTVENGIPAASGFFLITPNNPPTQVGTFTLSGSGVLTFTAGSGAPPPTAPSITAAPTNQTVVAGASATFAVSATGTAPLAYQWLFNGSPLGGQTAASLTLANVGVTNSGSYAVVVTNAAGAVTSAPPAVLRVLVAPVAADSSFSGTNFSTRFLSVSGLKYTLEYKNTLRDPVWTALTPSLTGDGTLRQLIDTNAPAPSRFYRLRVE